MNKRVNTKRIDSVPEFEDYLAELQQIVSELEGDNVGLSESLQKYETGVQHLKQCYKLLETAEKRIELLSGIDANGNPVVEPFEEPTDALASKARTRMHPKSETRKNRNATRSNVDMDDGPTLF